MNNQQVNLNFNIAKEDELSSIWKIIQQAILRRKKDGSTQWQDGYPNIETIKKDIENRVGYVIKITQILVAYAVIDSRIEPEYEQIEGKWLSDHPYLVIHRVAIDEKYVGQGIATQIFKEIENIANSRNIKSIKVDTNFDNIGMLKILEKLHYTYCGEVYYRGSARKAFEKVLE